MGLVSFDKAVGAGVHVKQDDGIRSFADVGSKPLKSPVTSSTGTGPVWRSAASSARAALATRSTRFRLDGATRWGRVAPVGELPAGRMLIRTP